MCSNRHDLLEMAVIESLPLRHPLCSPPRLFSCLQSTLGIHPLAPLHALIVEPHLADWMPKLTITNCEWPRGR
jgi:hypothetical protein